MEPCNRQGSLLRPCLVYKLARTLPSAQTPGKKQGVKAVLLVGPGVTLFQWYQATHPVLRTCKEND
jgi:hypothetical protein